MLSVLDVVSLPLHAAACHFSQVVSVIEIVIIPVEVASSPTAPPDECDVSSHLIYTEVMLMDYPQGKLCFSAAMPNGWHWSNLFPWKNVCAFSFWYVGPQVGLAPRAGWCHGTKRCLRGHFVKCKVNDVLFCQGVLDDVTLVMVRFDIGFDLRAFKWDIHQ